MLSVEELFERQKKNQEYMLRSGLYNDYVDMLTRTKELPFDFPLLSSYHIQQLVSEIGEVLDADKRWKNFRNSKCDQTAKLEELADCFIVLMNVAMFSGFDGQRLAEAIAGKIATVEKRITTEAKE